MDNENELEEKLIKLKLEKRELILMGKSSNKIDEAIKEVEKEMSKLKEFCSNK